MASIRLRYECRRVVGLVRRVVNNDRRIRRDRMGPLDVERSFAHDVDVLGGHSVLVDDLEAWWVGNAVELVEGLQIGFERGVDAFLDDGDRLAGAGTGDRCAARAGKADLVHAIGLPKLRGRDLAAEERKLAGDRVCALGCGSVNAR